MSGQRSWSWLSISFFLVCSIRGRSSHRALIVSPNEQRRLHFHCDTHAGGGTRGSHPPEAGPCCSLVRAFLRRRGALLLLVRRGIRRARAGLCLRRRSGG